jgi:hypothetical protein
MHTREWLGILAGTVMALVVTASMAADDGKGSSAAKLSSDSRAALSQTKIDK